MTDAEKKENARKRASEWYYNNLARAKESRKRYRSENVDRLRAAESERRFKMTEHQRAKRREYQNRWNAKNRDKVRKIARSQYHKHKSKRWDQTLRKQYGITLDRRYEMEREQNGLCAICNLPPNGRGSLHVDHCHLTGVVRGLLCYNCNAMIGRAKDSIHTLQRAIEYLGAPL